MAFARLRPCMVAATVAFALIGASAMSLAKSKEEKVAEKANSEKPPKIKEEKPKDEKPKSVVSGGSKYLQGVKDMLEASDDEWKVLEPKIMKIRALLKEVDAAIEHDGPKMPKLSKSGTLNIDPNRHSDIQERSEQLALLWFEPNTPLYMLRSQIAAMNASREKIRQQLTLTRAELRDLVTIRQEGVLVILGLLE